MVNKMCKCCGGALTRCPAPMPGARGWLDPHRCDPQSRFFLPNDQTKMNINIKKLRPNAVIPEYAHGPDEDAGFDLRAIEPVMLNPMRPTLVATGLSIELPPGYEAQIRPRSGLALKHGVVVANSPGTIDPSYRGEIGVILMWTGASRSTASRFVIHEGDRIAQMIVAKYERIQFTVTEQLNNSERGTGGFGSSGLN